MALHFKVSDALSDRHWGPFHKLLLDRRSTVDAAHQWLAERGYAISRAAVGSYRQHVRGPAFQAVGLAASDPALRRQLAGWAARLSGRELAGLAAYAAFLVNALRPKARRAQ